MIESNETNDAHPATGSNEVVFHETVQAPAGRSLALRAGILTGSAILFIVGAVAVMGASPSSSSGADPQASTPAATANPDASTAPRANGAPGGGGNRPGIAIRPFGRLGFPGGGFPGIGLGNITISAIDGSSLSLKTDDGWSRTITVTSATKITKAGATIAVGDLAVADRIRLGQQRASDGTYQVTAIAVVLPTVAGQVKAIDGNTVTITQLGGTTATIHVDGSTTYQVNGTKGSLSDLKVGAFIVAEGTQRSDGSLDAAAIHGGFGRTVGPAGPGGPGGFHPGFHPGFSGPGGGPKNPASSAAPTGSAS
jgi:hypothetical protein